MKEQFHNLITNTTSLVGYIAILMFVGAYLGGDQSYALDPSLLKGSLSENRSISNEEAMKTVTIMIDGQQYRATLHEELQAKHEFTY